MLTASVITWPELVQCEPDLGVLETEALIAHRQGDTSWRRWARIKSALRGLVGHAAERSENPELCSTLAYDAAYDHLLATWEVSE